MKKNVAMIAVSVLVIAAFSFIVFSGCGKQEKRFYVYNDSGSADNHYQPTGLMGDYKALTVNFNSAEKPHSGKSCIKIEYSGKATDNAGWTGIFWQEPANNWGDSAKGGLDLTGAVKLVFWARGEKGGEVISEFKAGGIQGKYPDTALFNIGPVTLTKGWKKYEIEIDKAANLSRIAGGFCWAAAQKDNAGGFVIYLDDIYYKM